jgi:transcriptional regulator with XRE-family HTH domain
MNAPQLSTGIDALDGLLGGLLPGDNVVWVAESGAPVTPFFEAFLSEGLRRDRCCVYVRTTPEDDDPLRIGPGVDLLEAGARGRYSDPASLEQALVEAGRRHRHTYVLVPSFDALAIRWGSDRAVAFYRRCCPRLFDVAALVYWGVSRASLRQRSLRQMGQVAQCVIELRSRQLRVLKADGRPARIQGHLSQVQTTRGSVSLSRERALGRVGRALELLRHERGLSQVDLARLAGVTPSAISQAESARRGLSLDTLLRLSERLGVTTDQLLGTGHTAGYTLRRGDETAPLAALFAGVDDGFRAYAIRLLAGQGGVPPFQAKGREVVIVGQGLIQLLVGSDTPVLRAGDAVMATSESVKGWRNLLGEASLLFWLLPD